MKAIIHDENVVEFWYGRELAPYLGYVQWRRFESVIGKAKDACIMASGATENDFADVGKIVKAGATEKLVQDFKLTRYACYLIAQNGDPRKKEIAEAQTYFAIQTRYAEIQQMQEYKHLTTEEEMRLFLRRQMKEHNSQLADAAKNAGVKEPWEYARFQNAGYKAFTMVWTKMPFIGIKDLPKNRKSLIIWEAPNLPLIFSVPPRQKKSSEKKTSRASKASSS